MDKKIVFKTLNVLLFIAFAYVHVFFFSPYINSIFHGRLGSWGVGILIAGLWGNITKMVLVKSPFSDEKYKIINNIFIIIGLSLIIISIINILL